MYRTNLIESLFLVLFFSHCALGGLLGGGLRWEPSSLSMVAKQGDKSTEAVFTFTNTSATSVEVVKITTSCSCTTAELAKKLYEPGESGALNVKFVFGGRKGRQEKSIVVQTADGKPAVLLLRVEIPDVVIVEPSELVWKVGETAEQNFDVTVSDPTSVKVEGVRTLGKGFEARIEEGEAGKKFRISVRPVHFERPVKGTVRLELEDPRSRSIYLRVGVEK